MMDRRAFPGSLAPLAAPRAAEAQPTGRIARVRIVAQNSPLWVLQLGTVRSHGGGHGTDGCGRSP